MHSTPIGFVRSARKKIGLNQPNKSPTSTGRSQPAMDPTKGTPMAAFVLIHGAWEAGWAWNSVERHLRAAGHEVVCPSLTGLGERSHLLNSEVDLEMHVRDILGVIKWQRLQHVTLVGHSYGGMVATGVADRAQERIGSLIYLDAFMPKDGQCLFDLIPHDRAAGMQKVAEENGEGWYVPVSALPSQHVSEPSEVALLKELCVAQPLATFSQRLLR
jgi:pimeloyl-ACP methyl ester carboxylesterase